MNDTQRALSDLTERYCDAWRRHNGCGPYSEALLGIPSPCTVSQDERGVFWLPQPFSIRPGLDAVGRAIDIQLQEDAQNFYSTQFAGDMQVSLDGRAITLLQTWSEDDFRRVQENLIGHLVMQRRLKQTPTVFLATTEDDMEIVSLSNLTGEVILEKPGTAQRIILAPTLALFLSLLVPIVC